MNAKCALIFVSLLPLILGGCASSHPSGPAQWIVVSTNVPSPRLATAVVPANMRTATNNPTAQLRDLLVTSGVSTQLLSRVSENKPLTLPDLEELTKVDADVVLNYLRTTDAVYVLRASDLERLRQAGVNERILDYLLATRLQPTIIPYYRPSPIYPDYYYYRDPFFYSPFYRPYYSYPYRHHHPRSIIRKK